jgi:hypothetical protein
MKPRLVKNDVTTLARKTASENLPCSLEGEEVLTG